jgi:hypothetical protein
MRNLGWFIALLAACVTIHAAESFFPPECPTKGSLEVVDDPVKWADTCFQAVNGRLPLSQASGETASMYRDLNLDGVDEHLEVRGVGNKLKQIYVFQKLADSFRYMGRLNAHPEFYVARDRNNRLVILNVYRAGANKVYLQQIEYMDGEFSLVRQDPME